MPKSPDDQVAPMAAAMEWVSRITTISLEMVLPGLAGQWLDQKWGTNFLALVGFALGLTIGIWHLLALTKQRPAGSRDSSGQRQIGPADKAGREIKPTDREDSSDSSK